MGDTESSRNRARIVALLEGRLSQPQFEKLEQDLLGNAELRRIWIDMVDLEFELEECISERQPLPSTGNRGNRGVWFGLAAVLAGLAVLISFVLPKNYSSFESVAIPGLEDVAIVMDAKGVTWNSQSGQALSSGSYLKPGTLKLDSGELELVFLSGATVMLEGPAEIQILSEKLACLNYGKVAARVPEEAIGFTLKTPDAAIVDLGTEFSANVDTDGKSAVHVFDGEVHLSLLGEDGSTLSGARVAGGSSAVVRPSEHSVIEVDLENVSDMIRVPGQNHSLLLISESYRSWVDGNDPVIYWTFEDIKGSVVHSRSKTEVAGSIVGNVDVVRNVGNQALFFPDRADGMRYVLADGHLPSLGNGNYTIEFLVKPDRFHYATVAGIFAGEAPQPDHLNVIELAHESHLIHRPNCFRFLYRWPSDQNSSRGEVNAFSNQSFLPRKWQHVVAVKENRAIAIYLNGKLSRRVEKREESHRREYELILGQIDKHRPIRQFNGLIDEFALYPKALQAEEISNHFDDLLKTNPDLL